MMITQNTLAFSVIFAYIHTKIKRKKVGFDVSRLVPEREGGLVENVRREEREKKAPFCSAFKSKACLLAQNSSQPLSSSAL